MVNEVEIQNIEQMRVQAGIDDVELRDQIRRLHVGDSVRLTFLITGGKTETLPVRITSIRGRNFTGELCEAAATSRVGEVCRDIPMTFSRVHIHSVSRSAGNPQPNPRKGSRPGRKASAKSGGQYAAITQSQDHAGG